MSQEKDLQKLYDDVRNQPRDYFIKSLLHFREIICSTKYTVEQKFVDVAENILKK